MMGPAPISAAPKETPLGADGTENPPLSENNNKLFENSAFNLPAALSNVYPA